MQIQLLAQYFSLSDVRSKREYDESHVITARRVKKVYQQSQNLGSLATPQEVGRMGDCLQDRSLTVITAGPGFQVTTTKKSLVSGNSMQ